MGFKKGKLSEMQAQMEAQEKRIKELTGIVSEKDAKISGLKKEFGAFETKLEQRNAEISELKREVNNLRAKIGGFQTSNENYKKKIINLRADYDAKIDEYVGVVARLKGEINQHIHCLKDRDEKILALNDNLATIKVAKQELEHELAYQMLPWYKKIFKKKS